MLLHLESVYLKLVLFTNLSVALWLSLQLSSLQSQHLIPNSWWPEQTNTDTGRFHHFTQSFVLSPKLSNTNREKTGSEFSCTVKTHENCFSTNYILGIVTSFPAQRLFWEPPERKRLPTRDTSTKRSWWLALSMVWGWASWFKQLLVAGEPET